MIGPYTTLKARGYSGHVESFFLDQQPVLYRVNGDDIQLIPTYGSETYCFGAKIISNYFNGPGVRQPGWTDESHFTLPRRTYYPYSGDRGKAPIQIYIDVDPYVEYDGPPPVYSNSGSVVHFPQFGSPGFQIKVTRFVEDIGEVFIDTGETYTLRFHTFNTSAPGFPDVAIETYDQVFDVSNSNVSIDFYAYEQYDGRHYGRHLDHMDLIYKGDLVSTFYPQTHPASPPVPALVTKTRNQALIFNFDEGIEIG